VEKQSIHQVVQGVKFEVYNMEQMRRGNWRGSPTILW